MSRPTAVISSATRNGLTSSPPPPGCPNTPPMSPVSASRSDSAGASPSVRSTARSRSGSNATTTASKVRPSASSTSVPLSPATTWAFVTTRSGPTKNPLPSWMREHASPVDLHGRLHDLVGDGGGQPALLGRGAGVGRRPEGVEHLGERLVADEPAQGRKRVGRVGEPIADLAGDRRAAGLLGHAAPGRGPAPARATTARPARRPRRSPPPAARSALARRAGRQLRVEPAAEHQAERHARSAPRPPATRRRRGTWSPGRRPASRARSAAAGRRPRRGRGRGRATTWRGRRTPAGTRRRPRSRRARSERCRTRSPLVLPSSVAPAFGSSAQQPRTRQEARVGHHPVVGPDGLALDVPAAVQHLDRVRPCRTPRRSARRAAARPA